MSWLGIGSSEVGEIEDDLYTRVKDALSDDLLKNDRARGRGLAIGLARLVADRLDAEQLAAVDLAERYQAGTGSEAERLLHVERIGRRARFGPESDTVGNSLNWVVFASLSTNTDLDAFGGERVVEEALGAGLSVDQIDAVFARHLPNFVLRKVRDAALD